MHKWPLSIQTVLPEAWAETEKLFALLAELGMTGVELNIADPWNTDLLEMMTLLARENLTLLNFASGLTAKAFDLSLSAVDELRRKESVDRCSELLELFSCKTGGIIIGFFKGPPSPEGEKARECFQRSLEGLTPVAEKCGISLLIEATNRYESSVANSLDDTWSFLEALPRNVVKMLPDTFHMNIEESDMFGALKRHLGRYPSIHVSDNNRHFPGLGAIDFGAVFASLSDIGFAGDVAIEGNIKNDFAGDTKTSAEFLFRAMQGD